MMHKFIYAKKQINMNDIIFSFYKKTFISHAWLNIYKKIIEHFDAINDVLYGILTTIVTTILRFIDNPICWIHFSQKIIKKQLSAYFLITKEVKTLIYITNLVKMYHRQIRKITKYQSTFHRYIPEEWFYLVYRNVRKNKQFRLQIGP